MKIPSLRFWFVLASTCALAASLHAQADKAETAKLEGTWVGGVRFPAGKNKGGSATMVQISEMTIKDGKIVACKDGKGLSLGNCESLALDPAKKTLDAKGNTKDHNGVFQGIYRMNEGKLEWCASNPGKPRPDDYYTVAQVQFHMVFTKKP